MTEENKKMCEYNKQIHFTKEANKYHVDKCVMKTMEKMSDKQKCIRYMTGVMNANNASKSCSIKDVENICEDHKKNFTLNDAQKLCSLKNQASSEFWKQKHMPKLNSIPEEKTMPVEQIEQPKNWMDKMREQEPQSNQEGTWLDKMRKL